MTYPYFHRRIPRRWNNKQIFSHIVNFSAHIINGTDVDNFNLIDDFRGACAVKGNVPVAGHVKRVDRGDIFARFCFVRKRWRVIISHSNLICHWVSGPIWENWGIFSQFAMWLSHSSFYIYKTDQLSYQFQQFSARFDSATNKWSLPLYSGANFVYRTHRPNK